MLGTDGRLYDSDFDFDGDGKLNAYEYSVMDDLVFGHEDACTSDESELEDDLILFLIIIYFLYLFLTVFFSLMSIHLELLGAMSFFSQHYELLIFFYLLYNS